MRTLWVLVLAAEQTMIAALFVERGGCYYDLDGIDPWDEERDARLYEGPHPVVAHPPCSRWCRLAGLVEARYGHKRGDDGGCFAAALAAVRRWGGVLEHPAYSDAWHAHDLSAPPTGGGWVNADFLGGWTCYVEQGRYGHPAKKATWLYACLPQLPSLRWGHTPDRDVEATVSWCHNGRSGLLPRGRIGDLPSNSQHTGWAERKRLSPRQASATPEAFRDALIAMAQSARTR